MITREEVSKRLGEAINETPMTETEIALQLGIKQPTVSQYISGDAIPSLITFANLCVIIDVEPADILGTRDTSYLK